MTWNTVFFANFFLGRILLFFLSLGWFAFHFRDRRTEMGPKYYIYAGIYVIFVLNCTPVLRQGDEWGGPTLNNFLSRELFFNFIYLYLYMKFKFERLLFCKFFPSSCGSRRYGHGEKTKISLTFSAHQMMEALRNVSTKACTPDRLENFLLFFFCLGFF